MQARKSRHAIIDKLAETIAAPREELSEYAPRMIVIKIDPAKIKDVIGPGGKVINKIIADTGVEKIDIEDDGSVFITSLDGASGDKAKQIVENLTQATVVVGETYLGTVTRIITIGAFVQILPGKEGLVHISQLAPTRVERVEDVVKVGDEIIVKVIEIDGQGRINLSRKALLGGVSGNGDYAARGRRAAARRARLPARCRALRVHRRRAGAGDRTDDATRNEPSSTSEPLAPAEANADVDESPAHSIFGAAAYQRKRFANRSRNRAVDVIERQSVEQVATIDGIGSHGTAGVVRKPEGAHGRCGAFVRKSAGIWRCGIGHVHGPGSQRKPLARSARSPRIPSSVILPDDAPLTFSDACFERQPHARLIGVGQRRSLQRVALELHRRAAPLASA